MINQPNNNKKSIKNHERIRTKRRRKILGGSQCGVLHECLYARDGMADNLHDFHCGDVQEIHFWRLDQGKPQPLRR